MNHQEEKIKQIKRRVLRDMLDNIKLCNIQAVRVI